MWVTFRHATRAVQQSDGRRTAPGGGPRRYWPAGPRPGCCPGIGARSDRTQ
nr:MAG TPA: hypothetical protein [Caudoviricetes sp.]